MRVSVRLCRLSSGLIRMWESEVLREVRVEVVQRRGV